MSTDIVIGIDISGKSLDIHILPELRPSAAVRKRCFGHR